MKKALSLLLVAIMVFTMLPSAVFAVSPNEVIVYSDFFSVKDSYYQYAESSSYAAATSDYDGAMVAINGAIADAKSTVNILSYGILASQMQAIFNDVNSNPAYFYLGGFSYNCNYKNIVKDVNFTYFYETTEILQMRTDYEAAISQALSWIKTGMSNADKILVMHDYLILNTKYDYDNFLNGTVPDISHTAYGVLVDGVAVCDGYSLAFKDLMTRLGISAIFVSSDEMSHAWNMVKLNGKWYHIDVTWDDPIFKAADGWFNDDYDLEGRVDHDYFLLSDSAISNTIPPHSGWAPTTYIANSTIYDGKYTDIKSGMFWHEGYFYYNSLGKLTRSRFDLSEKSVLKTINGSDNNYSYLAVYDNQIYYNYTDSTKTLINRINFDGTAETPVVTINSPSGGVTRRITELVIQDDSLKYTVYRKPAIGIPQYSVNNHPLLKREILARDGSTTVIDAETGFIYGLEAGLTTNGFENRFIRISGDIRLEYEFVAGAFGTGTKLKLLDKTTQEVLATYLIVIFGDIDGDGAVMANDALATLQNSSGMVAFTDVKRFAGDVDSNGSILAGDALKILQFSSGMITEF